MIVICVIDSFGHDHDYDFNLYIGIERIIEDIMFLNKYVRFCTYILKLCLQNFSFNPIFSLIKTKCIRICYS